MERFVRIVHGSLDVAAPKPSFDLILINILAEVIVERAPALAERLKRGGYVIASGILDYKADDVIGALRAAGIETAEKIQQEDWIALVGVKS